MLNVLKLFNYSPPNFDIKIDKKTREFGASGPNKAFEILSVGDNEYAHYLHIKGKQWMMYEDENHHQAAQLFSHYYIASGNVITTGLGLGIREKWLLNNPNVKSLTILERNEDVIEYHREVNPTLFEKANIINCDAKEYKGKCNTLLLDHYEFETMEEIISDVKNICDNNIECDKMWVWHLETQLLADLHSLPESTIVDNFRNGVFKININTLKDIKYYYYLIKNKKLSKLPDLTQDELQLILTMYTNFFQKL